MKWKIDNSRPIYLQLAEQIQGQIIAGIRSPGSRIEAVRELAAQAEVNPNTMQKALVELEHRGLLYSQRTSGRFVTEDKEMIENMRSHLAKNRIEAFICEMKELGYTRQQIFQIVKEVLKAEEKEDRKNA